MIKDTTFAGKAQLSREDTTSDTISRKLAIDALGECQTYLFDTHDPDKKISLEDGVYAIEQLPPAEPERDEWCTDCKEYDSERHCCPRFNRVIRNALKDAEPERKKGKWVDLKCNQCGQVDMSKPNYCPNCGADMREVEE